jgi:hypothetical protein
MATLPMKEYEHNGLKFWVLEKGEKFYPHKTEQGKGMIIDSEIKGSLRPFSGVQLSSLTEEQAYDLGYGPENHEESFSALGQLKYYINEALKAKNIPELRAGEGPSVTKTWPIRTYRKQLKIYQVWDAAIPLDRILILTT